MESGDVRLAPPFWRHDAHTLDCLQRGINRAILATQNKLSRGTAPASVVDIGAGSAPYRALFEKLGAKYTTCDMGSEDDSVDLAKPDVTLVPGSEIAISSHSADWVI